MTPAAKLRAATGYLILHHPFIATPLLRLKLAPNPAMPTAGVDGRSIFYNEDFVAGLNCEETIFLLAHEVLHVALRERGREALHDGVLAQAGLVIAQSLFEVIAMLSSEARKVRRRAVAVRAVASRADFGGLRLARFGIRGVRAGRNTNSRRDHNQRNTEIHHLTFDANPACP